MECGNKSVPACVPLLSLFCMCITIITANGDPEKIPLYFSYITSKTGGFVSSGSIPVVDLALEQINNRTDILSNYTLNYTTILDSNVSDIIIYVSLK